MAITKLSYTRSKAGAKASLDYYTHRPNREGERTTRELFDSDGRVSKRHGYLLIKRAPGDTVFLRIVLSPDPHLEDAQKDLNLRALTEQTMTRLEKLLKQKHIQYIATEHADQTEIRHTHIIALVRAQNLARGQLTLQDLDALRAGATADAASMRQELDQARGRPRMRDGRGQAPSPSVSVPEPATEDQEQRPQVRSVRKEGLRRSEVPERSYGSTRPLPPSCPNCGPHIDMERHGRSFECRACGLEVRRGLGLGFEIERGTGLELSLEEVSGI